MLILLFSLLSVAPTAVIRVNQLGYLPDAPKVAVFCALEPTELTTFVVRNESGRSTAISLSLR